MIYAHNKDFDIIKYFFAERGFTLGPQSSKEREKPCMCAYIYIYIYSISLCLLTCGNRVSKFRGRPRMTLPSKLSNDISSASNSDQYFVRDFNVLELKTVTHLDILTDIARERDVDGWN